MRDLEDIREAFDSEVSPFSLVRLTLLRGLGVDYLKETGEIIVTLPEKLVMGMPQQQLSGTFTKYDPLRDSGRGIIELEEVDGDYYANVNCYQIEDFEIL